MKNKIETKRLMVKGGAAIVTAGCLLAAGLASAATDTWNGGAVPDGNWMNPGNWNGVTPTTNDLLVFTGGTQTASTNNFPAGTAFNKISFGSGASAFTLKGNAITLSSPTDAGSGQITGGSINNASAAVETIRLPIVLANGNHTISSSGGALKMNGSITRSNGAVATMSGTINVTGGFSVAGNANGILGGWAVFNNNWATLDASSNVVAYAAYTDVAGGGTIADNSASNVRIPTAGTAINISGTTHVNSLLFSGGTAAQTVNLPTGAKLVLGQNGGIFNSSAIASGGTYRNLTLGASPATSCGILTAGDGVNPATITFGSAPLPSAAGFATVNASIQDNGSAAVTVVVAGAYLSINGTTTTTGANMATNTYSGGTYILQGRVSQPNPFTFGSGPVYIVSGGQANMGCQVPNEFFIEGSGTVENQGMGALRLYSAGGTYGYTGNLPGTIHLTGLANVCADNIVDATKLIGFSGKVTGPGSLGIGSPTATTRSGIINIGSTNGAFAIANDYVGDTRINGINGGTISSTLRICNPADNNIMPHGATGSYAGGKTGDLILNGVASTRQAIFELNGSTQTINGLVSTVTSPANNIVQDSAGGGALILGDNNATATFGGIIQNGLAITKLGTGTETLSGANTYTGNTTINAGTLATTTAATGAGNYSVSNNAALGVTTATPGGTLQVNNLAFGPSGTALNLSAGTLGDPTAAIVNVAGALNMNGNVNISLSGVGLTAGGPFTVMTYAAGSRTGSGNFNLANSPRVVATLNDDKINGIVSITIISADTAVKWNGGVAGNWDISNSGNTIWQTVPSGSTTYYIESGSGNDVVQFDDTATGTTNVNLTTTLTPQSITVNSTNKNFLFIGSGKITGSTGLTKNGNGTLTIGNSGNNDFSGNIAINAGTLVISNTSAIGNTLSGAGSLTKNGNGTLTLSGDGSAFTGPVTVNGGTLTVLNTLSLATASSITVTNGGTLDIGINSVALALEPITVSGSGVGGGGAIANSSGYSGGAVATSFQNLTMAGDTTIGGPGRLDFRSTDVNGGADAVLNTGGHAYKLTKTSVSTLQLSSVQIDGALGDIDVQQGTLSFQGNMPSLGNAGNTLTVFGGATVQFNSVGNELKKALTVNDGGIVQNSGGANTFDGPVTLLGNGLFNIGASGMTFTNVISGPGSLSKVTGNVQMTLTASNTYTGNTVISAGQLALVEPGDIRNSASIALGVNTILDVNSRTDQTLTLLGGHSLTGSGSLNGNLVDAATSTVAPGTSVSTGVLTVNGNAVLNGTNIIKLVETNLTSDLLAVSGTLQLGGTLKVVNLAGSLQSGDSFQIFGAGGGFSGSFTSISPAIPGYNLAWDTNALATTGFLTVTGAGANNSPTNLVTSFDGANLTLTWPMDHTGWRLQVQTNNLSTGLGSNWSDVPGSTSTNQVVIPASPANGAVFYRMVYP